MEEKKRIMFVSYLKAFWWIFWYDLFRKPISTITWVLFFPMLVYGFVCRVQDGTWDIMISGMFWLAVPIAVCKGFKALIRLSDGYYPWESMSEKKKYFEQRISFVQRKLKSWLDKRGYTVDEEN